MRRSDGFVRAGLFCQLERRVSQAIFELMPERCKCASTACQARPTDQVSRMERHARPGCSSSDRSTLESSL